MKFINLHGHTSISDGLGSTENIIQRAVDLGHRALAITDHGSVGGWIEFWRIAKSKGIKPILGCEIYVEHDRGVGHMTVLAKNETGIKSIIKLITLGHMSARKQPAVTLRDLLKHHEGVILLSGCPASPLNRASDAEQYVFIKSLEHIFGDDFYIEVTFSMDGSWVNPLEQAEQYGLPYVITTDYHFINQKDAKLHRRVNKYLRGYSFDNENLWIMDYDDVVRLAQDNGFTGEVDYAVKCINEIVDKVEDIEFNYKVNLPAPPNAKSIILHVASGAIGNIPEWNSVYQKRFEEEVRVIDRLGYFEYFWMVYETVKWAKQNNIHINHGRGSAAGSLILYMLGITTVDPIKYDLIFSRFLNESRGDYPDIDIDFQDSRRDEVIEYVSTRWNAVPIATTARWKHKSLVRDLCRMYEIPSYVADAAAESEDSDAFIDLIANHDDIAYAYNMLLGQIRHNGKHASGFVISTGLYPLERQQDGVLAVPFSTGGYGDDLTPFGLIKFDFLSLSALSARARMEELSGVKPAEFGKDLKTLALFQSGDLNGVFQFSSSGMQEITKSMGITKAEDIAVAVALFRPGPLGSGLANDYGNLVKNPRKIHPLIDAVLEETGGIMIYQEQLMRVFSVMTGLPDTETDKVRKLVGKKLITSPLWDKYKNLFISSCVNKGMTQYDAEHMWGEIESHGSYSFNKSHSISYAKLAWDTAYYKANYPVAFWAAMLQYDEPNRFMYLMDMARSGVKIVPAHINVSSRMFEVTRDGVVFPISAISGIGHIAEFAILTEREHGGDFKSIKDFCDRVPKRKANKSVKRALYSMGAFEGFTDVESLGFTPEEILDIGKLTTRELELKYFGFAFPTQRLIDKLDSMKTQTDTETMGMVIDMKDGNGKYGHYYMFSLYPKKKRSVFFFNKMETPVKLGQVILIKHSSLKRRGVPISYEVIG